MAVIAEQTSGWTCDNSCSKALILTMLLNGDTEVLRHLLKISSEYLIVMLSLLTSVTDRESMVVRILRSWSLVRIILPDWLIIVHRFQLIVF